MARIRAAEWETEEYWRARISGTWTADCIRNKALIPRVSYVAVEEDLMVGFIAGHLTRRHQCDGELEWINVIPERRRSGVASELLRRLAEWFAGQKVFRVCVDVDPAKTAVRRFYMCHGAIDLNKHWLVWNDITAVLRER